VSDFWKSDTFRIVQAMKATGNQPGLIERWKALVTDWAHARPTEPEGAAVLSWLPLWQPRPFYTAAELAPIFPALAVALRFADRLHFQRSAARLENDLKFAGLPWHVIDGRTFFAVERLHFWREASALEWATQMEIARA
jgi:hypothetical protein